MTLFQKAYQHFLRRFVLSRGREPLSVGEFKSIENEAVNWLNKTKGAQGLPGDAPKTPPFQGWKPKVIQGGKGIESLLKSGDVKKGVAPKTTAKTLADKRDKGLLLSEATDELQQMKLRNKQAIERFEKKMGKKKTVEDFRDKGDWDPSGMATGGLAYMLGEPNTRTEALQEFGVVTDPWGMYTDPSLYAKGERSAGSPQRGGYADGGVGHGPWTMGQAAPTPDQEQNLDTPQPQVMGTPNPMHMPQGIPSVAPPTMQPQYQHQMMQQAMAQQMMGQQPRMGYADGDEVFNPLWELDDLLEEALKDKRKREMEKLMDLENWDPQDPTYHAQGGRIGLAGGGMTRRAFMKLMSGLAALPFIGKGVAKKAAAPAVKEVTETITRNAEGIPTYAFDLIEVVKAKGTREIMEGIYKRNPPSTKYTYKDVEVIEDGLGNTSVKKPQTKTGTWTDEGTDDVIVDDYVDREVGFEIKQGEIVKGKDGKPIKAGDEYNESTAYLRGDPDGGVDVDEVVEVIDDADHLDLKKIADEKHITKSGKTYYDWTGMEFPDLPKKTKKASGGLAHMLGE